MISSANVLVRTFEDGGQRHLNLKGKVHNCEPRHNYNDLTTGQ